MPDAKGTRRSGAAAKRSTAAKKPTAAAKKPAAKSTAKRAPTGAAAKNAKLGKVSARAKAAATSPSAEQRKRAEELRKAAAEHKRPSGQRMSRSKRVMRDALVVELRAQRVPWAQIAAIDGRTTRQLERVVAAWDGDPAMLGPLNMRPMDTIEGMLRRQGMLYRLFFQIAIDGDSDNSRVAALRGMAQVDRDHAARAGGAAADGGRHGRGAAGVAAG
jgi:hypothetical protein